MMALKSSIREEYKTYTSQSMPNVSGNALFLAAMANTQTTEDYADASERLKTARLRAGFHSAKEAAEAFGWTVVTYQKHENGERGIKPTIAQRYARAFGVTPEWILYDRGKNSKNNSAMVAPTFSLPVKATVAAGFFQEPAVVEGGVDDVDGGGKYIPSERVALPPDEKYPHGVQYAVRVSGESVNRAISNGGWCVCVSLESFPGGLEAAAAMHPQKGGLVHAVAERGDLEEHTLKRLKYVNGKFELWPDSDDQRFQRVVTLDGNDTVRVVGVGVRKVELL